jgi:hypothetical protein
LRLGDGNPNDLITQLEYKAQKENLNFIEELVFENGAVYKGKKVLT